MVKIAISSHGLIHNTKVILPQRFSTHLYTKYKLPKGDCQEVLTNYFKSPFLNVS